MIGYLALTVTAYVRRVLRWVSSSRSLKIAFDVEFPPMNWLTSFADERSPRDLKELVGLSFEEDVNGASTLAIAGLMYMLYGSQPTTAATMVDDLSEFVGSVDDLWDYFAENEILSGADQTISDADFIEQNTIEFGGDVPRESYVEFKGDIDSILPDKLTVSTPHEPVVKALFLIANLNVSGLEQ